MNDEALEIANELAQVRALNSLELHLAMRAARTLRTQVTLIEKLQNEIAMLSIDLAVAKGFVKQTD